MAIPIGVYERPSVAVANLLKGDPRAALQALVDPESLSPQRTSSLWEKMTGGLKSAAEKNFLLRGIMSVVTDPFVIVGLLLSSRFPAVAAQNLFKYGKKFAGYAHAPGMFEKLFARGERLFAGTHLPMMMVKSGKLVADVKETRLGTKGFVGLIEKFNKKTGAGLTRQQAHQVAAYLADDRMRGSSAWGLLKNAKLEPHVQSFADGMRNLLNDIHGKELTAIAQTEVGKKALAAHGMEGLGKIKGYWPMTELRTPAGEAAYSTARLRELNLAKYGERYKNVLSATNKITGRMLARGEGWLPDLEQLRATGFEVNMAKYNARIKAIRAQQVQSLMKEGVAATDITEKMIPGPRHYSLDLAPVMENYVSSIARPYVWTATKTGQWAGLTNTTNKAGNTVPLTAYSKNKGKVVNVADMSFGEGMMQEMGRVQNPDMHRIFMDDYLPLVQGNLTESQLTSMLSWSNKKMGLVEALGNEQGMARFIPKGMRQKMKDIVLRGSPGQAQGKVASWFYHSTLGFNPASAMQNSMQTLISTLPLVGGKAYTEGVASSMKKAGKYFELRGKGLTNAKAFEQAFPEFHISHLAPEPLTQSILKELNNSWDAAPSIAGIKGSLGTKTAIEKLKSASMFMFQKTELANRVVSFEAGLAHARHGGMWSRKTGVTTRAIDHGAAVVRATQFPAGPEQMPRILMKLPAPWRQFMYFPIRYASFLAESTLAGGKSVRDWGTIGRTMAASAATYQIGKNVLGVDLERSLMFGALPGPTYEGSPFYPAPVVPPLLSVLASPAMALHQGRLDPLKRAASLLVPGGTAARRAYRNLAPRYAGYSTPDPDGKIPVFNDTGMKIDSVSKMQLIARAVGLRPNDLVKEQELTRYLLKHREHLRNYRREYIQARMEGDPEKAQIIQGEFKRAYPELGEIQVKPADIKAAEDRRMMTRLQRLMKMMPKAFRPQFQDVVNTTMGGMTANRMYGMGIQEPPPMMPFGFQSGNQFPGANLGGFGF